MRNLMVAIEGCDAAGKHTHSERLATRLSASLFSFPDYNTEIGELINRHLHAEWVTRETVQTDDQSTYTVQHNPHLDALVFQSVQTANKYEIAPEIVEARRKGPVILDRYWPSAVAYGGVDGIDPQWLIRVHLMLPQPDIFILLDIDLEHSIARRPERRDRYERDHEGMTKRIEAYRQLWDRMSSFRDWLGRAPQWGIVDARADTDTVADRIWAEVQREAAILEG